MPSCSVAGAQCPVPGLTPSSPPVVPFYVRAMGLRDKTLGVMIAGSWRNSKGSRWVILGAASSWQVYGVSTVSELCRILEMQRASSLLLPLCSHPPTCRAGPLGSPWFLLTVCPWGCHCTLLHTIPYKI